jgi:predicted dehydrogenase
MKGATNVIRVAVVGAGSISPSHIEAYLTFPERCKIVSVVDIYPEKAAEKIERYGLDAVAVSDYRAALDGGQVDLVSVCTPPGTHAQTAIGVLSRGIAALVEKPMALSLEECDSMLQAAQSSNAQLSIVAQNRFRTPMMKLRSVLQAGLIGKLVHAQVESYWWRGHSYYDLWWRGTWQEEGGGCTLNHAVHHVDVLQWMTGLPVEIQAMMANVSHDNAEVEDLSIAVMRYGNGALGQLTSSVVHHGQEQQVVFQGEKARISAPWKTYASTSRSNGFPDEDIETEAVIQSYYDQLPAVEHEGHTGQIDDVLSALEQSRPVYIDGNEGRKTLEIITGIYKSAITGQRVSIPLAKGDPFTTKQGLLEVAPHFHEKAVALTQFEDEAITTTGG